MIPTLAAVLVPGLFAGPTAARAQTVGLGPVLQNTVIGPDAGG